MKMSKLFLLLSLFIVLNETRVFKKCKVAKLLFAKGMDGYHSYFLEDWVCMAFHASNFNSKNKTDHEDLSYYGIFQLTGALYCGEKTPRLNLFLPGNVICDTCCDNFLDNDIRDDIDCLKAIIHYEGGMDSWDAWRNNCKGQDNGAWIKGCRIRRRSLDK